MYKQWDQGIVSRALDVNGAVNVSAIGSLVSSYMHVMKDIEYYSANGRSASCTNTGSLAHYTRRMIIGLGSGYPV